MIPGTDSFSVAQSETFGMYQATVGFTCMLTTFAIVVVSVVVRQKLLALRLRVHFREIEGQIAEQVKMIHLDDNVALDYIISQESALSATINQIRNRAVTAKHLCQEVGKLLKDNTWSALIAAEILISEIASALAAQAASPAAPAAPQRASWEVKLETLIQTYGRKIAAAAKASTLNTAQTEKRAAKNFGKLAAAGITPFDTPH